MESRRLIEAKTRFTTHEREVLAVVHCAKIWRHYLDRSKTIVFTDHQSLQYSTSTFHLSKRLTKWMGHLAQYDNQIRYLKGTSNILADGLSRLPIAEKTTELKTCGAMRNPRSTTIMKSKTFHKRKISGLSCLAGKL